MRKIIIRWNYITRIVRIVRFTIRIFGNLLYKRYKRDIDINGEFLMIGILENIQR